MAQHRSLPPLVGAYANGKIEWHGLEDVDFELLGYLLACHLIIEHYLDHFLRSISGSELDFESARLQFWQKVALLDNVRFAESYDFRPALKHLNTLRNRFAHRVNATLTMEDLHPLLTAIDRVSREPMNPATPRLALEWFTSLACSYFAGAISLAAIAKGPQGARRKRRS